MCFKCVYNYIWFIEENVWRISFFCKFIFRFVEFELINLLLYYNQHIALLNFSYKCIFKLFIDHKLCFCNADFLYLSTLALWIYKIVYFQWFKRKKRKFGSYDIQILISILETQNAINRLLFQGNICYPVWKLIMPQVECFLKKAFGHYSI